MKVEFTGRCHNYHEYLCIYKMREKATRVKTIYLVCSYEIATMTYVDKQSVQKIRILEQFSAFMSEWNYTKIE